jgi:hypothetical protein
MFLIQTDNISELLAKHQPSSLPTRKLLSINEVPKSQLGLEKLMANNSWRACARLAQTLITECERSQIEQALHVI